MSLFKVSKTARAKHIGTYHYDLINAKYAKDEVGSEYHIYRRDPTTFGMKWTKVM